jgi:glutaminyl-tRNA synthetase
MDSGRDFIRQIIDRDVAAGTHGGKVVTRFPPEPNGFLHIGHAKSICLNFGLAEEYADARCHLRFDDTNPLTEDPRYVEAIQEDVRWLGFDWGEHLYFASDYFEAMVGFAEELIRKGLAYVDSQSEAEIREGRGTVTEPGTPSPYRDRSVDENLDLFRRMRAGEFPNGAHVLRGKIDMASPNMIMRDPVFYRILHEEHYRTGDEWCIYPLYDFAHCLEDALEGVTHSLCTLEFENNREIYDWIIENTSVPSRPRQYEFARLNLDYTVMSKRKLLRLVNEGDVSGWDDPRMPTIAGLRRRGVTPEAIRAFSEMIGVAKADSRVDMGKLEFAIRDDLNRKAPRVMAVLRPLRVVLTNWPEGEVDELDAPYFPRDVGLEGSRAVPFSGELFIDRDDFQEDPEPGFRRLVPGEEVRLRYGYVIRCDEVVRDGDGGVVELRCSYDPQTRGGNTPDGRKVKGTIQWVSAAHAVPCEVRLYDRLFTEADPDRAVVAKEKEAGEGAALDFRAFLNPESLEVVEGALVEPSVLDDAPDTRYQFERVGYFWRDPVDSGAGGLVFNRVVGLRDTWTTRGHGRGELPALRGRGQGTTDPAPRTSRPKETDASGPAAPTPPPTLPPEVQARADALVRDFSLPEMDAGILARDPAVEAFYRAAVEAFPGDGGAGPLANWVIHELPPHQGDREPADLPFGPGELAALVALVEEGAVSSSGGGEILEVLAREGGDPRKIMERLDLAQVSDAGALEPVVAQVLEANPGKVAEYRSGKTGLLGFFMGQVMLATGGKADPEVAKGLLEEALGRD